MYMVIIIYADLSSCMQVDLRSVSGIIAKSAADVLPLCACSSVDRAVASDAMCAGSIPVRRTMLFKALLSTSRRLTAVSRIQSVLRLNLKMFVA